MKPVKPVPMHNLRIYNMQKDFIVLFLRWKSWNIYVHMLFLWYYRFFLMILPPNSDMYYLFSFILAWFTFLFFVGKSGIYLEIFPFISYLLPNHLLPEIFPEIFPRPNSNSAFICWIFYEYVRARLLWITCVRFLTLAKLEPANVDINH